MKKKRPAALLEVLIALSLIAICAVPLIRQPIANHRAEMAQIERVEAGRIAAWTFSEIKEKFLKNEIRWGQVPGLKKQSPQFLLSDAKLQLPPLPSKTIKRTYTLRTLEEKQLETEGRTYKLVAVQLNIGSNQFTYRLTVFNEDATPLAI